MKGFYREAGFGLKLILMEFEAGGSTSNGTLRLHPRADIDGNF